MPKKIIILTAAFLFLTACQSSNNQERSSASKTDKKRDRVAVTKSNSSSRRQSQSQSSSIGTKQSSSSSSDQVASSNGLYHSVQGRDGEVIIVNKKHSLDPSYVPGENPIAKEAFLLLLGDMKTAGFAVSDTYSGFRDYNYQANIYQTFVARDGQAKTDTYSARPGFSEHQTGLAFDIMDSSGALLTEPNASAWLAQNAHHYGFIVRYPQGKEAITGFVHESWHIRYIGSEATDIYQSGLTLEEYYGVPGGDYAQ